MMVNGPTQGRTNSALVVAGIPAFNAEATIAKVILLTRRYVDKIILVDDGSTDDTAMIAEGLGADILFHNKNKGKGEALRTIFRAARDQQADVLVLLDADGQHDPSEIPRIVEPILKGHADVVVGSRKRSPEMTSRSRRAAQKFLDAATAVRDQDGELVDSQSGFKAYSKRAITQLDIKEPGMGAESESLKEAARIGLAISQVAVGVSYGGRSDHTLNPVLHFSDVLMTLVKVTILKRPVRFLGIPAIALVLVGLYWWLQILGIYNSTREFAIGNALVASVVLITGFFLGIAALILLSITLMIQEKLKE